MKWDFTDLGERYRMELSNGALIHRQVSSAGDADLTVTLTKPELLTILAGDGTAGIPMVGDEGVLGGLLGLLGEPDTNFAIVTP